VATGPVVLPRSIVPSGPACGVHAYASVLAFPVRVFDPALRQRRPRHGLPADAIDRASPLAAASSGRGFLVPVAALPGDCQTVAMGDGASDRESLFERVKDMRPFIFPLFHQFGGVRVTAEDALTLLPGTYINDVIVNFHVHYLRSTALQREQMEGVIALPSYSFKLILDKGPYGPISACRKLDIVSYHQGLRWINPAPIYPLIIVTSIVIVGNVRALVF